MEERANESLPKTINIGIPKIAEKVQLNLQYNLQPPYSNGDPRQASFSIYEPFATE